VGIAIEGMCEGGEGTCFYVCVYYYAKNVRGRGDYLGLARIQCYSINVQRRGYLWLCVLLLANRGMKKRREERVQSLNVRKRVSFILSNCDLGLNVTELCSLVDSDFW